MALVGALRVKNEARWITEVLLAIKPICERTYVFDDHSTDETYTLALDTGATVLRSHFRGLDEGRDKDWLVRRIKEDYRVGTWVLMVDGDEVITPEGAREVQRLASVPNEIAYSFRIRYLWNDRATVRTDGIYATFRRPSMFMIQGDCSLMRSSHKGNLHCSSVPQGHLTRCVPANVDLLHLGYMHREDRIRKYEWYNRVDSKNPIEDGYRHCVIGDLFPADSAFRWGGPLKLEALCTPAV